MKQIYETTVIDEPTGFSASFLSIPACSFDEPAILSDAEAIAGMLHLQLNSRLYPFALHGTFVDIFQRAGEEMTSRSKGRRFLVSDLDQFADYLSYADFIPFEQSPLETIALATLLARAAKRNPGAAAGAFIAYQLAPDPHSFVVVLTTTAGLIIGGATDTIRTVFDDEGRRLLRRLMMHPGAKRQPSKRRSRSKSNESRSKSDES